MIKESWFGCSVGKAMMENEIDINRIWNLLYKLYIQYKLIMSVAYVYQYLETFCGLSHIFLNIPIVFNSAYCMCFTKGRIGTNTLLREMEDEENWTTIYSAHLHFIWFLLDTKYSSITYGNGMVKRQRLFNYETDILVETTQVYVVKPLLG